MPSRLRDRPRRRTFAGLATTVAGLAIVGLGVSSAAASAWFVFGLGDRSPITQMSTLLLVGLQSSDMQTALSAFVESEPGAQALSQENELSFVEGAATSHGNPVENRRTRLESLTVLREQLAEVGVRWDDILPLAFGGVRARVQDSGLMNRPATVVTGNLYFASGGALFSIELSARKCGRAYYAVEVWDWTRVEAVPTVDAVKECVTRAFETFQGTKDTDTSALAISQERQIFVKL